MTQDGGLASHRELLADYGDTYVRYRNGDTRLTLGAQTIIWGRVDEIPLADRVSRVDLTRFALDDLADRRRAQLATRWEQNFRRLQAGRGVAAGIPCRAAAGRGQHLEPGQPHHRSDHRHRSGTHRPLGAVPRASTRTSTAAAAAPCD